jgi:hypothetical protein
MLQSFANVMLSEAKASAFSQPAEKAVSSPAAQNDILAHFAVQNESAF